MYIMRGSVAAVPAGGRSKVSMVMLTRDLLRSSDKEHFGAFHGTGFCPRIQVDTANARCGALLMKTIPQRFGSGDVG